jgi:hypothetical protein
MTNEEILKLAIDKAVKNGYQIDTIVEIAFDDIDWNSLHPT